MFRLPFPGKGMCGVAVSCNAEDLRLSEWMAQARRDADRFGDGFPTVFHRRSREGWRGTMDLPDWLGHTAAF